MDFSAMERAVYGNKNLEDDPELMAELLALEEEEKQSRAPVPPAPTAAASRGQSRPAAPGGYGIDPSIMAAALADTGDGEIDGLEEDDDLLNELSELVGDEPSSSAPAALPNKATRAAPPPPPSHQPAPVAPAPTAPASHNLRELLKFYEKMKSDSEKENNEPKTRRYQRSVVKLKELIVKADKGQRIDPSEIPPAPPGWQPSPTLTASAPTAVATPEPITVPAIAHPAHHPTANPVRAVHHSPPETPAPAAPQPPPVPARKEPAPSSSVAAAPQSKKEEVLAILQRRKAANVSNGKAALAANDREAAMGYVEMSKMFEQAITALESASVDDLDLSEIPGTPPPYRKKTEPTTFMDHLEIRLQRYQDLADGAKKDGNERKLRMYQRTVTTYKEAVVAAKRGQPVNVADLPVLPDMAPLPPQSSGGQAPRPQAAVTAQPAAPSQPRPAVHLPAVGPTADSGPPGLSRNATQLQFLLQRQHQFKEAALAAKNRGDIELAKKYLISAKGFDKMIVASKNGLPVNIKDTPIPPQVSTPAAALQPKIIPSTTSATGVEGRGEALAMLEKGLIEQIQLAENNRMKFTRLGDVGKVKLFEGWAKSSKQDLLLIREVAKQGLRVPKFHQEMRQIPSADLFLDLAEDVLEMTIVQCRDVPLPSGYESTHANIFIKYTFPYPTEALQTGKSKSITGTTSPEFDEVVIFQIGSKKARGSKLARVLKRAPLKLEINQKGGFLRSDKLLGTCEWKLDELEGKAEMEESLPLKDGRKAVGGLLSLRVRIREPLGDTKLHISQHKWIVLDA